MIFTTFVPLETVPHAVSVMLLSPAALEIPPLIDTWLAVTAPQAAVMMVRFVGEPEVTTSVVVSDPRSKVLFPGSKEILIVCPTVTEVVAVHWIV